MLYADLLTSTAAYTKRSDTAPLVPIWIAMTEEKLNRDLRHFLGIVRTPIVVATEYQDAPADLNQVRSARLIDAPYWQLDQLTTEQLNDRRAQRVEGTLDSICLRGSELAFSPIPAASWNVELSYYADVPPLTADNPTNWVLAHYPSLYLWGVLSEATNFYEDDEQLQKFASLFRDALIGANAASAKAEAGHVLSPRPSSAQVF